MPNIIKDKNGTHPQVFKRVDKADTKITPIQISKTFTLESGSEISSGNPFDNNNDYMVLYANYVSSTPEIGPDGVASLFNSPEIREFRKNANGAYAFSVYHSLNHLFYKYKNDAFKTLGSITPLDKSTKILYQSASVFSIPQKKMGLKVKPGSFIYSGSVNLHSDKYENIVDSAINTSSFVTNEIYYEGFNEYFDTNRVVNFNTSSGVVYVPGVTTSNGSQASIGYSAYFSGSGYIEQTDIDGYFDRDHDYAISFFISGANTSVNNELVIGKVKESSTEQYPFKIELSGSNELIFSVSGQTRLKNEITSSTDVSSSWTHIVCQKTGSTIEMYVNASLHSSLTSNTLLSIDKINSYKTSSAIINNNFPVKIGGYDIPTDTIQYNNLHGYLDEIRIYNNALTSTQVSSLADRTEGGTLLQTNRVGNAFHNNGIFVITSPDYRYHNVLSTTYTASYQSTINIFEFSTLCKIAGGDFNLTVNHSALKDDNQTYQTAVTSSNFQPYITTVGLYNEHAQLLAIGKLANPVKNRNDIDTNILVRVDLDQDQFANIKETNELD